MEVEVEVEAEAEFEYSLETREKSRELPFVVLLPFKTFGDRSVMLIDELSIVVVDIDSLGDRRLIDVVDSNRLDAIVRYYISREIWRFCR